MNRLSIYMYPLKGISVDQLNRFANNYQTWSTFQFIYEKKYV